MREPRRLGDLPDLDHTYVVDGSGLRPVAELVSGDRVVRLALWSDQPGVHVYTGSALGADLGRPAPRSGIALEPQHFPDAVHHADWPSTVLRPGETYRWTSELRLSVAGVS